MSAALAESRNRYIPRQTYAEAVDTLILLLNAGHVDDDLAVRARRFFKDMPSKMLRIVMKEGSATRTVEVGARLEPSDCFLRLLAAVRAGDTNEIAILEHEFRS